MGCFRRYKQALCSPRAPHSSHPSHFLLALTLLLSRCLLISSTMVSALESTTSLSSTKVSLLNELNIHLTSIGLVVDCEGCGNALALTLCQTDCHGNSGKPMVRVSFLSKLPSS